MDPRTLKTYEHISMQPGAYTQRETDKVKAALKKAVDTLDSNKSYLTSWSETFYLSSEESACVAIRGFAAIANPTREDVERLIYQLSQMKPNESVTKIVIATLKMDLDNALGWPDLCETVCRLESFGNGKNSLEKVRELWKQAKYADQLSNAIAKVQSDFYESKLSGYEHVQVFSYWDDEGNWKKLFSKPQYAGIFIDALSHLSHLQSAATSDNFAKIYTIHDSNCLEYMSDIDIELKKLAINPNNSAKSRVINNRDIAARALHQVALENAAKKVFDTVMQRHVQNPQHLSAAYAAIVEPQQQEQQLQIHLQQKQQKQASIVVAPKPYYPPQAKPLMEPMPPPYNPVATSETNREVSPGTVSSVGQFGDSASKKEKKRQQQQERTDQQEGVARSQSVSPGFEFA